MVAVIIDPLDKTIHHNLVDLFECSIIQIKERLKSIPIDASNLHQIIKTVMEAVENTPIKGIEQKNLALNLIKQIIDEIKDSQVQLTLLNLYENGSIENLMELVIDASKGKLNINTAIDVGIETTKGCFKFWYRRFKKA
jgi:flagellar hook-basal body complex protein FliE